MRKDNSSRGQDSLSICNNQYEYNQLRQPQTSKTKITTKIQSNKHFSCLHIHKNTVYLGTKNSRLFIYNISLPELIQFQSQNDDFILKQQKIITPHCQTISHVKANDTFFVTVPQTDQDSFISIWAVTTKQFLTVLKGHESQISQIVFMKDQKHLATSSWDCTIRIWSLQDLQKEQPIKKFQGNYPFLQLKQFNDQVLIFGGDDCYLMFWNWRKNEIIKKQFGHAGSVTYIQIMDNNRIFTSGGDNKFKFWQVIVTQLNEPSHSQHVIDFKSKYQIKKIQQHKQEYDSIVFGTFYQKYLLLIDRQGQLFLFANEEYYYHLTNYFQYNENITGIDIFEDFVLLTTTKGNLKHFNIRRQIEKLNIILKQQKFIPYSQTNILKINSDQSRKNMNAQENLNQNNNINLSEN